MYPRGAVQLPRITHQSSRAHQYPSKGIDGRACDRQGVGASPPNPQPSTQNPELLTRKQGGPLEIARHPILKVRCEHFALPLEPFEPWAGQTRGWNHHILVQIVFWSVAVLRSTFWIGVPAVSSGSCTSRPNRFLTHTPERRDLNPKPSTWIARPNCSSTTPRPSRKWLIKCLRTEKLLISTTKLNGPFCKHTVWHEYRGRIVPRISVVPHASGWLNVFVPSNY